MPGALKPSSFVRTMFRGADVIYGLRVVRECRDAQFASLHRDDLDVTDVLRRLNKFDGHRVLTTSGVRCARLWRSVAAAPRKAVFGGLALKIRPSLDELRPIDVVERVHVDDGVFSAVNCARGNRHHAARQADVEICRSRPEPISPDLGVLVDLQMETAVRMGCPDGLVLRAERAAAGTNRNGLPGLGPVEPHADGSAMAACVDLSIGDRIVHDTL